MLVGLSVHRDELVGDLGQQRGRHRGSAGERPGPALRRERPAQHHDAVVESAAGLGDRVGDAGAVGHGDARLHPRLVVAGADEPEVGAVAAQQAEGGDDHRLAGTGLTGDDGESLAQLELGGVDDAQRRQREVLPHQAAPLLRRAAEPRQPVTGRSNLRTSRSANGAACSRASRTVSCPRTTSTRAPTGQVGGAATVAPQHAGGLLADDLDRQRRLRRDDQRPGEQRMGADRHHAAAPGPRARRSVRRR